jgi:hypothetical protein
MGQASYPTLFAKCVIVGEDTVDWFAENPYCRPAQPELAAGAKGKVCAALVSHHIIPNPNDGGHFAKRQINRRRVG